MVAFKVLTSNDFESVEEVEARLADFQDRYQEIAKPFEWKFTRKYLSRLFQRLSEQEHTLEHAA